MKMRPGKVFFAMWLGIVIFNLAIWAGIAWGVGSVVVSSVKAMSDKCGTTYSAEDKVALAGNLFCPSEE